MSTKLEKFYWDVFRPSWLQSCNKSVLEKYTQAVDWFVLWCRGDSAIEEMTDEKLEIFAVWLVETKRVSFNKKLGKNPGRAPVSRLRQIKRYALAKQSGCARDMRLSDFFKDVYLNDRTITELSVRTYRKMITSLNRFNGSELMLSELSTAMVDNWLAHLKKKPDKAQGIVNAIWQLAYELGYVPSGPHRAEENKPAAPIVTHGDSLRMLCTSKYFPAKLTIRSDHTKSQYRFALNNFAESLGHEPTLADLTDDNLVAMMRMMLDRSSAPKTVNERKGRISALWTWLAKRGYINVFPTTDRVPEPKRTPTGWSREQLETLFKAFDSERVMIAGIPGPQWWRTLHAIAWTTGERISALLSITFDSIDFSSGYLTIPAEDRKSQTQDMVYRLSPEMLELLADFRKPERELVFPWPFDRSYLWVRYKIIRKRAGLPTDRRSAFHRMRRSVASHLEAAGGDATQAMGHASRQTTVNSYLDPAIVRKESVELFKPWEARLPMASPVMPRIGLDIAAISSNTASSNPDIAAPGPSQSQSVGDQPTHAKEAKPPAWSPSAGQFSRLSVRAFAKSHFERNGCSKSYFRTMNASISAFENHGGGMLYIDELDIAVIDHAAAAWKGRYSERTVVDYQTVLVKLAKRWAKQWAFEHPATEKPNGAEGKS